MNSFHGIPKMKIEQHEIKDKKADDIKMRLLTNYKQICKPTRLICTTATLSSTESR